jgi:hypothetical protein
VLNLKFHCLPSFIILSNNYSEMVRVPNIHTSKGFWRWLNPASFWGGAATISCSPCALAALREDLGLWGGDGAFVPESWVPSARRPYPIFSIRVDSPHSRAYLKRERTAVATTLLLRGFVPSCEVWSGPTSAKKAAVPHIHISKRFRRWPNPAPQQSGAATISCSLAALAALREDLGLGVDGAFAPESWVRSASRPYLGPFDSRGFASFAGRFETAEDCRCYNSSSS